MVPRFSVSIQEGNGDKSILIIDSQGIHSIYLDGRPQPDDPYSNFKFSKASINRLLTVLNEIARREN